MSAVTEPTSRTNWREMNNRKKKFLETNLDQVPPGQVTDPNVTTTVLSSSTEKAMSVSIETSEFSELKIMRTRTRSATGPGSASIATLNSGGREDITTTSSTTCRNNSNSNNNNGNVNRSVSSSSVSTPPERDRSLSYVSVFSEPMTPPPNFSTATSKYSSPYSHIPPPPPVSTTTASSVLISNKNSSFSTSPAKTTIVPILTSPPRPLVTSKEIQVLPPLTVKEPTRSGKDGVKLKEAFLVESIPDVKGTKGREKSRRMEEEERRGPDRDLCTDFIVFVGDCFMCHGQRH